MDEEIDYLMTLSPTGIKKAENGNQEKIREWLNTPEGSVWGMPVWGHNFKSHQFEPAGETTEVNIELDTITRLQRDLPTVPIAGVQCRYPSFDEMEIVLVMGDGNVITNRD